MPYSIFRMRTTLRQLGVSKGVNPFAWEQEGKKGIVNDALTAQFKYGRGKNYLNDLLEYCWLVYSKAHLASGAQLIGRVGDLWVPSQLGKAGFTDTKTQTLWDSFTAGNIQVMDKWAPAVNDCWILGGVHRHAEFELVSVRSLENLWDFRGARHVVTAREILGLLHFGYKMHKTPGQTRLKCENPVKATEATIEEYDRYMKEMEAKGPGAVLSLMK